MKPGLERVEHLLRAVGSPEKQFRIVHVGGTNGKGSTSSMIAAVLSEHGLRTGLYTSPHVVDFSERITIDGRPIDGERVTELVERLLPASLDIEATFFEIVTAAAALHFAEERVDIVVAEVGLGGRLDATNALDSVLSVITKIAIDHAEILGNEPASIAAEKAGIIREDGVVVCGADGEALDVIRGVAAARRARLVASAEEALVDRISVTPNGSLFDLEYGGATFEGLSISMLGRHQVENARNAAVSVLELARSGALDLSERALRRGLLEASLAGRMQIIDRRPTVVADVAHNPDGAVTLMNAVNEVFEFERAIVVLGIMADKDVRGFLSALIDRADLVVLTKPGTTRAADPEVLAAIAAELGLRSVVVPSPGAAIARALSEASEADLVLVTGSHYTVGDVLVSMGVGQALETG